MNTELIGDVTSIDHNSYCIANRNIFDIAGRQIDRSSCMVVAGICRTRLNMIDTGPTDVSTWRRFSVETDAATNYNFMRNLAVV